MKHLTRTIYRRLKKAKSKSGIRTYEEKDKDHCAFFRTGRDLSGDCLVYRDWVLLSGAVCPGNLY